MRTSIERVMLPAVLVGCAPSRAAGAVSLDAGREGPLLHSNQHTLVPPGQDASALPEMAPSWAPEARRADSRAVGTC